MLHQVNEHTRSKLILTYHTVKNLKNIHISGCFIMLSQNKIL